MNIESNRLAVIARLSEKASYVGRTALMKYCYFLQVLRRVPLGYSFSLYSYGPFDSDVLSDLDNAEATGGVKTSVVYHPGGYGYRIEPGPHLETVKRWGQEFLSQYSADIDWIIAQFGSMNASQLELASTIVYSDREAKAKSEKLSQEQLARRVHDVKPHFTIGQILAEVSDLGNRELLRSL